MQPQEPTMRSMTFANEGNTKLNKSKELNAHMSVHDQSQDEYTSKLFNLGGN